LKVTRSVAQALLLADDFPDGDFEDMRAEDGADFGVFQDPFCHAFSLAPFSPAEDPLDVPL
jgi:hypothetical protein